MPGPRVPAPQPAPSDASQPAASLKRVLIIGIPLLLILIAICAYFQLHPAPVISPQTQPSAAGTSPSAAPQSKQWERESIYQAAQAIGTVDKLAGTYQPQKRMAEIHFPSYAPVDELKKAFLDGYDAGYKE